VDQTERTLWTERDEGGSVQCLIRSCCAGAELQILITSTPGDESTIALRELYPTRSDLYERARELQAHYRDQNARRHRLPKPAVSPADSIDSDPPAHRR
jgi:hypothetical protein